MGYGHSDEELEACLTEHEVRDKDVIIMFTDGISDNLFDDEIRALL